MWKSKNSAKDKKTRENMVSFTKYDSENLIFLRFV